VTLYAVDGSGMLVKLMRTTPTASFAPDAMGVLPMVSDAALLTDQSHIVFQRDHDLVSRSLVGSPNETILLHDNLTIYFSPSIGDTDRTVVWSQATIAMPDISNLYIGDYHEPLVGTVVDVQMSGYLSGAILSHDGATLYFTHAATSTDPATLFATTRRCVD
jgi:hypothetical protein